MNTFVLDIEPTGINPYHIEIIEIEGKKLERIQNVRYIINLILFKYILY